MTDFNPQARRPRCLFGTSLRSRNNGLSDDVEQSRYHMSLLTGLMCTHFVEER